MRFGLTLLTDLPWAEARPRWQAAEDMGFDHAWTYDHLVWGGLVGSPWRGATPVLAAAAAVTSTIGLGTLVSAPNFRHPFTLLRDVQAIDDISGGRFLLGLGTGGDLDSSVLGVAELSVRERVDRLQEFVDLFLELRAGDQVTRRGRWFSTVDARTLPLAGDVPVVVAGDGPRSVRYAARVGDAWVTTGPRGAGLEEWLAGLATSSAVLEEALGAQGRDAGTFRRFVLLDSSSRYTLTSVGLFEDVVGRVAELGFTDAVTHWPRPESPYQGSVDVLEAVARDVLPRWRPTLDQN